MYKLNLKNFIDLVVLVAIFALSGEFMSANAQSGTWRLNSIQVYNQLDSTYATIVGENKNSAGGYVDINVNGKVYDLCPGGMEKLRFVWQFEFDVTNANPGGAFGVNIKAGQLSVSAPCRDSIASFSYMVVNGSSGSSSPFPAQFDRLIDGSRFVTGNGFYIWAAGNKTNGIGSVVMKDYPAVVGQNYAFFTVDIGIRGSGYIKYIYLYQRTS